MRVRGRRLLRLRVRRAVVGARRMAAGTLVQRRPRQPSPHPGVPQRLSRLHTLFRVPLQTAADEVEEERVVAVLQRRLELPRAGRAAVLAAPRGAAGQRDRAVGHGHRLRVSRVALRADEVLGTFAGVDHVFGRHTQQLDDAGELVALVLAGQQWKAGEQLAQNAPQTPHVDGGVISQTEYHFRSTVEPRLDVRVQTFVLVAAGAEIDHLCKWKAAHQNFA